MKRLIFSIAIGILTVSVVAAQGSARDRTEISGLLTEFLTAAGRNDAAVHDRFWADDLIYTRSTGQRVNKPEVMHGVRLAEAAKVGNQTPVYSAADIRIQQYGHAAVVAFRLISTSPKEGRREVSEFLNTGTFIKRNGKWQVVAWQATAIPKPQNQTTN